MCRSCHLDGLSNFEIGVEFWKVYFLDFCWIEKKNKLLCNIFIEIIEPFHYRSWRCPIIHFTATLKKHNNKMILYSTPISIINALSKWHDPYKNLLKYLLWSRCDPRDPLCLQNLPFHLHNLPLHNYLHPDLVLEHIHRNHHCQLYREIYAAIICHNDELSSSLSWLKIVHNSVFWYMKIKRMGIKEILRRTWLTSENKIKPPKSFSKQSSQVNSYSNSTHNCDK